MYVVPWSFVLFQDCSFWNFVCIYIYILFVKLLLYIYFEIACDYKFCVFLVQYMYGYNNSCFHMNFQQIKQCCFGSFCIFNICP
jgi:hypothetical protein